VPLPTAKSGLVVMRGTRETLDTVQALIAKIDKPPKQVALNVRIYSVSDSPESTWGLLRATAQKDRINSTYSLGQLDVDILAKGGVMLDENYTAAFEFLQSEDKATLVTEQEVAVIDGFTASLNDSRTRGNLVTTWTVDQNGNRISSSNYEAQTVGGILSFTPQVDDRGRVTLEVNVNMSSFDGPEQIAPNGQATFQPRRDTTLNTILRLVDGQSMVIGGLTTKNDSRQFAGIPYLSKLPIIGQFLGHTNTTHTTNHLFIAIKVNIIDDK
jgi:type II secretory pathway component GspD/PulD (secretin)